MTAAELRELALARREASTPLGRYQPIRIAGLELPGWTGTSRTVREGGLATLEHAPWLRSLRLDRLDLPGRSVLDVGCHIGSVTFEASRAGAARATGIDREPRVIADARIWHDLIARDDVWPLRGDVAFRVEDASVVVEPAEVVFVLSILHQIPAQATVLARIAACARETLVLEIQTQAPGLACIPLEVFADVTRPRPEGEAYGHGHYPTIACVERTMHDLGFGSVVHVGPGRVDGREVFHVHR